MKLIIAGSRGILVFADFIENLRYFHGLKITEVISGCAAGIDKSGEYYAEKYNIPVQKVPADWNKFGKMAVPIRNKQMAEEGDALLLIWDGESKGSANMKKEMLFKKKPVYEVILKKHND